MTAPSLGERLLGLCESARTELFLVSPFVKAKVLARILNQTAVDVPITLLTRWRVEEIQAGVSDLETFDLLAERGKSRLLLLSDLHAKYYRADSACLMGSANLTQRALGWAPPINVELLISIDRAHPELLHFETNLLEMAYPATASMVLEMRRLLEQLPPMRLAQATWSEQAEAPVLVHESQHTLWLPALRHPESLYKAYSGRGDELTAASRQAAYLDLQKVSPPAGLPESVFRATVASMLLQAKVVRQLDCFLEQPQRFGAVTQWLRNLIGTGNGSIDQDYAWQTLMRWLLYFLPERYEVTVPNYSEVFRRRR